MFSLIWLTCGGVSLNSYSYYSFVAAAAADDDELEPLKFPLILVAVVDVIISYICVGSDNSFIKVSKI